MVGSLVKSKSFAEDNFCVEFSTLSTSVGTITQLSSMGVVATRTSAFGTVEVALNVKQLEAKFSNALLQSQTLGTGSVQTHSNK